MAYKDALEDSLIQGTSVTYQSYIALLDEMTNLKKIVDSCKNFTDKPVQFDASVQTITGLQGVECEEILNSLASAYDAKQAECEKMCKKFKAQEIKLKDSEAIIKELYEKLDKVMQDLKSEKEECNRLRRLNRATGISSTNMAPLTSTRCSSVSQSIFKPHYQPPLAEVDGVVGNSVINSMRCAFCKETFNSEAELMEHWKTCSKCV